MKKHLAVICMVSVIFGCNAEPPITVELGRNPFWGGPQLHITAKQDTVTINDIKINRGNCKATIHERLPYQIPFGQVLKADAPTCQNLVEVYISTSEGDYNFSFDS